MNRSSLLRRLPGALFMLVIGLFVVGSARAALTLIPGGLNPGDQFRVAFVTSGGRNSTSAIIGDYDQFVSNLALAAGINTYFGDAVTWQAIVSTPAVGITPAISAISRLPATSPAIYRIDGALVATSGADLWDGSILNPINRTELNVGVPAGDETNTWVWTGTFSNGGNGGVNALGPSGSGAIFGRANRTTASWVTTDASLPRSDQFRLYAYSSVLTVPTGASPVPEPGSLLILAGLSSMGLVCHFGRRRGTKKVSASSESALTI